MTIQRMDHVGVVVEDLEAAVGLDDVRVEIVFVQTPDGHGRLELTRFLRPTASAAEPEAPVTTVGLRRLVFAFDDIDATVARLRARGHDLVGEIARYEDLYRLCYVRGPEGIIVALAEELG